MYRVLKARKQNHITDHFIYIISNVITDPFNPCPQKGATPAHTTAAATTRSSSNSCTSIVFSSSKGLILNTFLHPCVCVCVRARSICFVAIYYPLATSL